VLGTDDPGDALVEEGRWINGWPVTRPGDLLGERELWRVEAGDSRGGGVFDLSFDWADGSWQLVGCVD
jgi:hypothetical protein